jgi:histidinol-phosphate/aromatic aminotransferase/cobyric acid decarboxylase-like protein
MITLTSQERNTYEHLKTLKDKAGSHSPSVFTLFQKLPALKFKVDACFLSNPYATDLFLSYLNQDLIETRKLRDVLEFYPSQNHSIASLLGKALDLPAQNIFMGNGAAEIIQAVLHNFSRRKIIVNLPTFSSYYEFVKEGIDIVFYQLDKNNYFRLDLEDYIRFVKHEKPDTVILINPNNPNGDYIPFDGIKYLLEELKDVENVVIDESFIHFSFEDDLYQFKSASDLITCFPNLILIKSMSKDFGIAGVRAGYALMHEHRINHLLRYGYLWNLSGLAQYFFQLYVKEDFKSQYEKVRIQYVKETQEFFYQLSQIKGLKVYPSMANFVLIELVDGSRAADFFAKLLIGHGVYTRNCADKKGLDGEFIRIAAKSESDNQYILNSIKQVLS